MKTGGLYYIPMSRVLDEYEDPRQHHSQSVLLDILDPDEPFVLLDTVDVYNQYGHKMDYRRYKVLTKSGVVGWISDTFGCICEIEEL